MQNQITAPCNNRLARHVLKDCSSVSRIERSQQYFRYSFLVNSNDTSKIRDGDDANRRDKIFQT